MSMRMSVSMHMYIYDMRTYAYSTLTGSTVVDSKVVLLVHKAAENSRENCTFADTITVWYKSHTT